MYRAKDLLLCPFCGGEAKIKLAGFYIHIVCVKCDARATKYNTDTSDYTHNAKAEAFKAWNKRCWGYDFVLWTTIFFSVGCLIGIAMAFWLFLGLWGGF